MNSVISILRGINVGGQKKIPMKELKSLFEGLKFRNINTYIQSGNVIFSTDETNFKILSKKIEQKILERFNFEVPVVLRTAEELQTAIINNPFLKKKNIETDKLHLTFLSDIPQEENLVKIKEHQFMPDEFTINGKEVYVFCPNGYGKTKLTNTFFENKLKVTATTRNWRTVNELLKIAVVH
jgi:uncharacterized protein (DUF1697 family)